MRKQRRTLAIFAVPFSVLAIYACSSSSSSGGGGGTDSGTGGGGDSGGNTGKDSGVENDGGETDSGNPGDGGSLNPTTGLAAPAKVASAGPFVFADGLQWIPRATNPGFAISSVLESPPAGEMYLVTVANGASPLFNPDQAQFEPIGSGIDKTNVLYTCESTGAGQGIVKWTGTAPAQTATMVVSQYNAVNFNMPNDLVIRQSDGVIYFTDPDFNGTGNQGGHERVYRFPATIDGGANQVAVVDDFVNAEHPNGIAFSPDFKTLYIDTIVLNAVPAKGQLLKYTVATDGSTGTSTHVTDTAANPDAISVDNNGNIYVASDIGVEVFAPTGTKWGTIPKPGAPETHVASIAFGGADGKTLLMGCDVSVYSLSMNIPGPYVR